MKKIGIALFIISFGFFIVLLSMGKYQLTPSSLEAGIVMQDGKNDKFNFAKNTAVLKEINGKTYSNQFTFVEEIKKLLRQTNEVVISKNSISKEDISNLIYHSTLDGKVNFSAEAVAQTFPEATKSDSAKQKLIADNLSWVFGRELKNSEELGEILNNKKTDIDQSVVNAKGFDVNKFSNYLFTITKKSTTGFVSANRWLLFLLTLIFASIGVLINVLPDLKKYPGIKNDGIFKSAATNRGWIGIVVGTFLISFYVLLYWFPCYITPWIVMVDPLKKMLSGGGEASQWFLYGLMYTLAMLVMGVRVIIKYRHNKYQIIRTISVMFFQLGFAFLIPEILESLNEYSFNFVNMWPLDYDFFFEWNITGMIEKGTLGVFMLVWGIALFIIGVPIFVYFFGKRWYCSWVCGCGGLAETLGDPYRQLSDKSVKAWKIERWMIHLVLVFSVVMTALVLYTFFTDSSTIFGLNSFSVRKVYGFWVGSVFSGIIGTGFYPMLGNRTWCRFGCPLAAYLGLVQRFKSRFRITTNGGQCISCGNCSTYCEMGIDVRAYAQKGQNIVRSSCVGCGICSAVCPRGVLKLENGPEENRVSDLPIILGNDGIVKLNENME
ncbi:MAG: 4Fe-4S dicluster domain-containing protein [Flavobacteriales bacterium]